MNEFISGSIPDPRSQEEKDKDYQHVELSGGIPLTWYRDESGAPQYSVRNQDGSGSCVAQSSAKAIETHDKRAISAHPIYRRRSNFPSVGMYLQNAGDIVKKMGTTTETLDPSQNMSETQLNVPVSVQTPITEPTYVFVDVKNIDHIAEAIEMYGQCLITIGFDMAEYENNEKLVNNGKPATCYHCLCATYYFMDENDEKCILADESWGSAFVKQRVLTESYLKSRGTGAMYYILDDKPHFRFNNQLSYGMMDNVDVSFLQDILKFEGVMLKSVPSTGNYLSLTASAVLKWQIFHQVDTPTVLKQIGGKRIGPKSLAILNSLYN